MRTCLVDTGPFVAYLNRRDDRHEKVAAYIDGYKGHFVTTAAVVGEVMYFLSDLRNGPASFAKLLIASEVQILGPVTPAQTIRAAELMERYGDTPMDYADATLVLLAEEIGVTEIVTLDARGFSTYRTRKGKNFRLLLELPA